MGVVGYEKGYSPAQDTDTLTATTSSLWSPLYLDTFEMVSEDEDGKVMFKVNYHYMSQVKNASDTNSAARSRRLAQEAVTLSTSLPLSSSSSVFVRCDEERLDIMKVKYYFNFLLTRFEMLKKHPTQAFIIGLDDRCAHCSKMSVWQPHERVSTVWVDGVASSD